MPMPEPGETRPSSKDLSGKKDHGARTDRDDRMLTHLESYEHAVAPAVRFVGGVNSFLWKAGYNRHNDQLTLDNPFGRIPVANARDTFIQTAEPALASINSSTQDRDAQDYEMNSFLAS